jgi:hypothetical protein
MWGMKYEEQGRGIMADRFDLDAIDADDALLDLLAAGGESTRTAGQHDPAVMLLAELRLAVEVEDELPVETIDDPESFLARCATLNPMTDPFARKMATRGLALGVAAVAALSVSGVAAAVTGDPLSPYEKVIEKMVDAVRPQTSFQKEQLDGMPVVDRSKIVKVAKDYKQKQDEKVAAQETQAKTDPIPPASVVMPKDQQDVLQRTMPQLPEQPTVTTLEPTVPPPTKLPAKTDDKTTADDPVTTDPVTTEPTAPTTTEPTAPTTTEPTDPATTPEPTDPPTTTPADPPTTPTGETSTGSDTGTGNPTTAPTGVETPGSDDDGTKTPPADTDPADTDPTGDQQPGDVISQVPLTEVVEEILQPILPTPTGALVELESAEQFFGEGVSSIGKHSTGKVATGSVKETYPKGKHATTTPAEGKHAAIARAHGSTADADVLTILGVVNAPTR